MKNNIRLKLLSSAFALSFLFACAPKDTNNINFDFKTLKKSKKIELDNKVSKKQDLNKTNLENNNIIQDLVPLKNKKEILSKTKFGKKDPFSEGEIKSNKLNSDLKLTGFLNTEIKKYVFVSYLDNEGTITEDSIGGVNTTLLPNGAKVINIDPKKLKLVISFENEEYVLEL